jgi:ribosome-associated protein
MITIEIKEDKEFITLGQLLKIEGLISTGGEAKIYLSENEVLVDGEAESRRGRKLYRDMVVELNGETYKLI